MFLINLYIHIEVDQITKRSYVQKQFWKVYLLDFLQILGILDSKQVDVLIHILENTNSSNNTYIGTYRSTAEKTNLSLDTVRRVFKKLQDNNFLTKIQNGVYQVSLLIMIKGNEHKKQMLLNYYLEAEVKEENKKIKLIKLIILIFLIYKIILLKNKRKLQF